MHILQGSNEKTPNAVLFVQRNVRTEAKASVQHLGGAEAGKMSVASPYLEIGDPQNGGVGFLVSPSIQPVTCPPKQTHLILVFLKMDFGLLGWCVKGGQKQSKETKDFNWRATILRHPHIGCMFPRINHKGLGGLGSWFALFGRPAYHWASM